MGHRLSHSHSQRKIHKTSARPRTAKKDQDKDEEKSSSKKITGAAKQRLSKMGRSRMRVLRTAKKNLKSGIGKIEVEGRGHSLDWNWRVNFNVSVSLV